MEVLGGPDTKTVKRLIQELFRTSPLIPSQAALPERHCDSRLYFDYYNTCSRLAPPGDFGRGFSLSHLQIANIRIDPGNLPILCAVISRSPGGIWPCFASCRFSP